MTRPFDQLDVRALAIVCGGQATLAERAVASMQKCRSTNEQLGEQNFPLGGCVREQVRRYRRAQELYGPEGKGDGLLRSRSGITDPVPAVQFFGEAE